MGGAHLKTVKEVRGKDLPQGSFANTAQYCVASVVRMRIALEDQNSVPNSSQWLCHPLLVSISSHGHTHN